MRGIADLAKRQRLIGEILGKIETDLKEGKSESANHLMSLLTKEIRNEVLPLLPPGMLEPSTSLLGRIVYIIRWWRVIWEDLTCQLRTSNSRLEKLL